MSDTVSGEFERPEGRKYKKKEDVSEPGAAAADGGVGSSDFMKKVVTSTSTALSSSLDAGKKLVKRAQNSASDTEQAAKEEESMAVPLDKMTSPGLASEDSKKNSAQEEEEPVLQSEEVSRPPTKEKASSAADFAARMKTAAKTTTETLTTSAKTTKEKIVSSMNKKDTEKASKEKSDEFSKQESSATKPTEPVVGGDDSTTGAPKPVVAEDPTNSVSAKTDSKETSEVPPSPSKPDFAKRMKTAAKTTTQNIKTSAKTTKEKVASHMKKKDTDKVSKEKSAEFSKTQEPSTTSPTEPVVAKDSTTGAPGTVVAKKEPASTVSGKKDSKEKAAASEVSSLSQSGKMINVGPVFEFLLRDSSILIGCVLMVAAIPTYRNWNVITENQIPLSVSLAWMVVAFVVGRVAERWRGVRPPTSEISATQVDDIVVTAPKVTDAAAWEVEKVQEPRARHGIFLKTMGKFSKTKFKFSEKHPVKKAKGKFWTALNRRHSQEPEWEENARASVSKPLLQRLYRDPHLRRKKPSTAQPAEEEKESEGPSSEEVADVALGTFDLSTCSADTLAAEVVAPLFSLRGMDVFLTEDDVGAEDDMGNHPFLLKNGLRNTPTFLVNVMAAWANILIYFELPEWSKDLDNISENEDDPDDVKALKRFLNGDDEYRNQRLKILPQLVDGPRLCKMLAPAKKEITVSTAILPVGWRRDNGGGTGTQPMIEVELDLMSVKAMRYMASIVKNNVASLTVDLAVLIQKPDGAVEDEPSACLGLWRFDRVDISKCPPIPSRGVQEEVKRASMILNLSAEQMQEIVQEA